MKLKRGRHFEEAVLFSMAFFLILSSLSYASAVSCTTGTVDTICTISNTQYFNDGENFNGTGNLTITTSGSIQNSSYLKGIIINFSTITIQNDAQIAGGNITIYARNFTMTSGSLNATRLGYGPHLGPGAGGNASDYGGGGAGHGGRGGRGYYSGYKGAAGISYGSSLVPKTFGSGGGRTVSEASSGGAGGGIVRIIVTDTFVLNASIKVDGGNGVYRSGGGGSGGSILIYANNFAGDGNLSSKGGDGIEDAGTFGGGGGGGRIAVYYNTSSFTGISSSNVNRGGSSVEPGLRGTMIFIDQDDNSATLAYSFRFQGINGTANETTNTTFWNTANPEWYNFTSLNLAGVFVNSEQLYAVNITAINLSIDSSSYLDVAGKGYIMGLGPGRGTNVSWGASGAGHGGRGGRGYYTSIQTVGGFPYGSSLVPMTFGSGGGVSTSGGTTTGGSGGGIVILNVIDTLNLSGTINASGMNGAYRAGAGGSGGSVFITTNRFTGTGRIFCDGGNGDGDGAVNGGGGSGGRVAVYYNQSDFSGMESSTVKGGAVYTGGGDAGEIGTMIFVDSDNNDVAISSGFKVQGLSGIANESTTARRISFWSSSNPAVYNFSNLTILNGALVFQETSINLSFVYNSFTNFTWKCYGRNTYTGGFYVNYPTKLSLNITSSNMTLDRRSVIDLSSCGYDSNFGTGTSGTCQANSCGGASHGGYGGRGNNNNGAWPVPGTPYGSSLMPATFGSGAQNISAAYPGGRGGGTIKLEITDTLNLTGNITTNGGPGLGTTSYGVGGGAGGSIYAIINNIIGRGRFTADGGNGYDGGSYEGGGGSGGRIAVYYNTSTLDFSLSSVAGGTGGNLGVAAEPGSRGSQIFVSMPDNSATIVSGFRFQGLTTLSNETGTPNTTFWSSSNPAVYNFSGLTIMSGSQIFQGYSMVLKYTNNNFTNFTWKCYGSNFYSSNFYIDYPTQIYLNITSSNLTIDSSSSIDLSSCGYSYSAGPGTSGTCQANSCGGASHGGYGGRGNNNNGAWPVPGTPYGSSLMPATFGSGARSISGTYPGGRGGGIININLSDTLSLDGDIKVNGENGLSDSSTYGSGGGAGGSIYVRTKNIQGAGRFLAVGGNGYDGGYFEGGGGSGGRIAVYYNTSTFFYPSSSVAGGTGGNYGVAAEPGSRGSQIFVSMPDNSATIVSGFRFQGLTTLSNETGTPNTTFWSSSNPAVYNFSGLTIMSGSQIFQADSMNLSYTNHEFTNFNWTCYGRNFYSSNFYITYPTLITLGIIAKNLTLDQNSTIDLSSCGYSYSEGPGTASSCSANACAGASYGGRGGRGSNNGVLTTAAPIAYGLDKRPLDFGSGARSISGTYPGGRGGGVVKLEIADTLNLTGNIMANGENGLSDSSTYGSGGGAGGSIYIRAKNILGSGKLWSIGGNGYDGGSYEGGGGSGGRIFIFYGNSSLNLFNVNVTGGKGGNLGTPAERGENGTITIATMPIINSLNLSTTDSSKNETYQNLTVSLSSNNSGREDTTYIYNWYKNEILNATTLITDELIAYYPLDNNSFDYYNSFNGTSTSTSLVAGKMRNAFNFDGASSTMDVSYFRLSSTAGMSFSFWGKIDTTENFESIFQYGMDTTSSTQNFIRLGFHNDGGANRLRLWTQTSEAAYDNYYSNTVSSLGNGWNHYYVEWTGTTKKLYINGVQQNLNVWQRTSATSFSSFNASQALKIGYARSTSTNYYFDGQVDEFIVYNRSLSNAEIQQIYRGQLYGGNTMNEAETYWNESWNVGVTPADIYGLGLETKTSQLRILDLTPGNITLLSLANNTYLSNGTAINLTANLTEDSSGIKNATLYIYNSSGQLYYNQTATESLIEVFQKTIGFVKNLAEGAYTWFYKMFDWAGNLFTSQNRTITADFSYPRIDFVFPTPGNDTGKSGSFEINATIFEANLANVTINFNNTSTTFSTSSENLTNLGNGSWNFFYTQSGMITGNSYYYNLTAMDLATNKNYTETRKVNGNTPPDITSILRNSYSLDDLDPGYGLIIDANMTDLDDNFDSAILQWKNSTETGWNNITMANKTAKSIYNSLNATLPLPDYEDYITFRIWTNDTLGDISNSSSYIIPSFWDCTWNATSDLGATAGWDENKFIGNITINNTGDSNYSVNNCSLDFSVTHDLAQGRIYYDTEYIKNFKSYTIAAKSNQTIKINATFLSEVKQDNVIITLEEVRLRTSDRYRNVTAAIISNRAGPYLYQSLTDYPTSVYLTDTNFNLNGYLRNLMGTATVNITNTAYNVTFYWTLLSGSTNISGNQSSSFDNITDSNLYHLPVEVRFSDLGSMDSGVQAIYLHSRGYNLSGDLIIDANNNTLLTSSVNISFLCYNVTDGICVESCGYTQDPDCEKEVISILGASTNTGGGGGGVAKSEAVATAADFQIVRGEQNEIKVVFQNKDKNESLTQLTFSVAGKIAKYVDINPKKVSYLGPEQTIIISLVILSPSYISLGRQELTITLEGRKGPSSYTDSKKITLEIHELSSGKAYELLNSSINLIKELDEANLSSPFLNKLLKQSEEAMKIFNFETIRDNYKIIQEQVKYAIDAKQMIIELESLVISAQEKGIDVSESSRILKLAKLSIERREFGQAYKRAKDSQLIYALEIKGEFGTLSYYLREYPREISLAVVLFSLSSFGAYKMNALMLIKKRIKELKEEEKILNELVRIIQQQCFKEKKISMTEYETAMREYNKKLSSVAQELVEMEIKRLHLLRFTSKSKRLRIEKERIIELIKELQDDYMKKKKIETRTYELKMESFDKRLSEIEEYIATIEAKKAARGSGISLQIPKVG